MGGQVASVATTTFLLCGWQPVTRLDAKTTKTNTNKLNFRVYIILLLISEMADSFVN